MLTEEELLVTRPETWRWLRISESTLNKLIRDGDLHPLRIGRRVMFRPDEIKRFVKMQ